MTANNVTNVAHIDYDPKRYTATTYSNAVLSYRFVHALARASFAHAYSVEDAHGDTDGGACADLCRDGDGDSDSWSSGDG
jgi:hypothetical protein